MVALRYVALLLPLLSGCHVVERAERCGSLAGIMKEAAPKIAAVQILDSPTAEVLKEKGRLYGQLAAKLDEIDVKDTKVHDEQKLLIVHLQNLERHLIEAGDAVEAEKDFSKRQEEMRARHEKIREEKEKYADSQKPTSPVGVTTTPKKEEPKAPSPSAPSPPPPRSPNTLAGFLDRGKRPLENERHAPPTPPQHYTPNARKYERARHAAETIGRAIETSKRNLEAACQ